MLMRRLQRGVNLIEIAVVIAILSMVLAVAMPEMGQMFRTAGVRALAEGIQNGVQKARAEALKRNRIVTLWMVTPKDALPGATCALSATSGSWVVSMDNPTGECDNDPSETAAPRIIEVYGAGRPGGILTVSSADANGNAATSVSFNGLGQMVRTGTPIARIDIEHSSASSRRLRIQISTSGSVRLCDRDVSAPDTRACI